jgi:DNA-nicking Smr family endonuclease
MPKPRDPTPDEIAEFRDAIGEVAPVTHDRAELRRAPPPPVPKQSRADDRAVMREAMEAPSEIDGTDELAWVREGASRKILRKLGAGEYSVRDSLDLHDMTVPVATAALAGFLDENRRAGRLCVRVVHGKGLRSPEGPVLKRLVDRVLRHRGDVLAFRSARPADGGAGAVVVLLRGK